MGFIIMLANILITQVISFGVSYFSFHKNISELQNYYLIIFFDIVNISTSLCFLANPPSSLEQFCKINMLNIVLIKFQFSKILEYIYIKLAKYYSTNKM